ncbi:hypothetical protein [Companilactobacillus kedongensis]|uniref:hypothetical protein n=1 Tax=Companilactobacillus kedongensis TaxID=2486004 RepID=UPI000F78E3CA|nr:hypothetical protein [Companilactobacillus kedongensis]
MDENTKWLLKQIDELSARQNDYEKRALLLALKKVVSEQQIRIEQAQGELDGRLWDHDNW